jgi:hypothetical protein
MSNVKERLFGVFFYAKRIPNSESGLRSPSDEDPTGVIHKVGTPGRLRPGPKPFLEISKKFSEIIFYIKGEYLYLSR